MKKLMTGLCIALGLTMASQARAEITECTEITTIPMVITVQGVYCLKGNLVTAITSGNAIEIATNNVTIDFNGFKLGGLAAGSGTQATGVWANERRNIVLRNGSIRGFFYGIFIDGNTGTSSGHLIEDMILDNNTYIGIVAFGTGMLIRNNRIVDTGPNDVLADAYGMIVASASNSRIANNLISKTSETGTSYGIYLNDTSIMEVRGNSIFETNGGGSDYGISFKNTSAMTIIDNHILNTATTGTFGIFSGGGSSGINCIENVVFGFTTSISPVACNYSAGNHP